MPKKRKVITALPALPEREQKALEAVCACLIAKSWDHVSLDDLLFFEKSEHLAAFHNAVHIRMPVSMKEEIDRRRREIRSVLRGPHPPIEI